MCYNCRHMQYARHKKPLVIALFLIFTVSMALVSKNVAYAESVTPSKKTCHRASDYDGVLEGDDKNGYVCKYDSYLEGTWYYNAFIECPSGSYPTSFTERAGRNGSIVEPRSCVKGSRNTVEPTEVDCNPQATANTKKGDKNSGYFCDIGSSWASVTEQKPPRTFKCPAGSQPAGGNSIAYGRGENEGSLFALVCVSPNPPNPSSTLTPEKKKKATAAAAEAAGKDLLAKSPELAKITSDPKVVGECVIEAKQKAVTLVGPSRPSTFKEVMHKEIASCLAKKTGRSVDEIKAALGDADVEGAAAVGEEKQKTTEQELAQEQAAEGEEEKPKEECGGHVEGIGYFLCPILERLVDFADGTWGLFEYLLQTNPLPDDTSKPLPSAWSGLRDVANAILAIIFLAIIISQVSNIGISNYGVKKMLPRLIIAAVAINISYFLMQIITDIANILGSTLYDFISDLAPKVQYRDVGWATIITDIATTGIAVAAIGAGATAAGHAMSDMDPKVGLLLLFVFIVPAILGLIAGLMALVFRAGIIPVLAISAPIAFAAWVLPNTQKLFEKWKSTFLGMIFLYPLASLYCGGLKFVALSLMSENTKPQQVLFRMMGVTMLLLGSGFVAVLAIKSNSIMGSMIGGIKNIGTKLTAPAVNSLSSYAGALKGAKRAEFLAKDHSKAAEAAERNKYHRLDPRRLRARVKHATGRRMQAHDERMAQAKMQAKVYESAVEQEEKRKYEAKVAENPALLGRVAETVGGKAFIKEAAYKSANMELQSKYSGNAVKALNESDNEYVKTLAVKEIAERGSAGEIDQVREYLQKGGSIDNTDMAEALMKMKGRDAGVAAAGKEALNKLEQSGGKPVHTDVSEMHRLTQEGFNKLGDRGSAEQSATSIQAGGMEWEQAARILDDRHIMRDTPRENIGAIKASIQTSVTQQIRSGTMDAQQATKVLDNKQAMQNISDQTKKELESIVERATRPAGQASGTQQSGGAQAAASSGQDRQAHFAGQTASAAGASTTTTTSTTATATATPASSGSTRQGSSADNPTKRPPVPPVPPPPGRT